jgi:DNA (cytosine-5)-methyltransferase 1
MQYDNLSKIELINMCKKHKIKGYTGKNKSNLILLLENKHDVDVYNDNDNDKLKIADLFCGTGAFSLGLEQTGKFITIFANDLLPSSKIIYDLNFKHKLICEDIHNINVKNIPKCDILTGGFACQPFSIAGLRKGFADERSNVFWKIMEIIQHHKPRFVILENVKNLLTHDNKNTFTTIKNALEENGYHVIYNILDTSIITNIPQHRERIYIVCFKNNDDYKKFIDAGGLNFPKVKTLNIMDMLEHNVPNKYYYTSTSYPKVWELIKDSIKNINVVYQYRRVYVRENKSNLCPTLTANMGSGGHNVPLILDKNGIRKLTPRECFNFQGFPNTFKLPSHLADCHLYKLAGNAISLPVIKLIANRITNIL